MLKQGIAVNLADADDFAGGYDRVVYALIASACAEENPSRPLPNGGVLPINSFERLNTEISRRTEIVGIFANGAAMMRLGANLLE